MEVQDAFPGFKSRKVKILYRPHRAQRLRFPAAFSQGAERVKRKAPPNPYLRSALFMVKLREYLILFDPDNFCSLINENIL